MFELICHHTYRWGGAPIDLSPYDSHGLSPPDAESLPDGVTSGSGILRFALPGSRVSVPMSVRIRRASEGSRSRAGASGW